MGYTIFIIILSVTIIVACLLAIGYFQQKKLLEKDKKQAEDSQKSMNRIMKLSEVYYWELAQDGNIHLNCDISRQLGLKTNDLPCETLLSYIEQPGRDNLQKALQQEDTAETSVEVVVHHPNSDKINSLIIRIHHTQESGKSPRCYGFFVYNDDAYKAEKEYQEAFRLSEETAVKESFLSAMSHEIRTPLNTIVGFSDILVSQREYLSDEERETYGNYIEQSKEQLLKLLDDVMNYSDDRGKRPEMKLSKKSILDLMEETYQIHSVIIPKHLEFRLERGEDANVMVNRTSLLQVLSNLMNNAIKFTEKGSITLGWTLVDNEDKHQVIIYVEDTGIGIAEEDYENIFSKYYKVNNRSIGAGIGLPLCKDLVETMNGKISVSSKLGQGSRFEVHLPLM